MNILGNQSRRKGRKVPRVLTALFAVAFLFASCERFTDLTEDGSTEQNGGGSGGSGDTGAGARDAAKDFNTLDAAGRTIDKCRR